MSYLVFFVGATIILWLTFGREYMRDRGRLRVLALVFGIEPKRFETNGQLRRRVHEVVNQPPYSTIRGK